jgi:hypothetical protein
MSYMGFIARLERIGIKGLAMDVRHRGIQIFGWLAVIAGYCIALFLIRGVFIWVTRGLFTGRAVWILLGHLLFLAFAVYLFTVGRRAISIAKGDPRRRMRFGWGRMLLGTSLIFSAASTQFHLFPVSVVQLEYEDQTQAAAGNVTDIAICIGSLFLILSGVRKGSRRQTMKADLPPTLGPSSGGTSDPTRRVRSNELTAAGPLV